MDLKDLLKAGVHFGHKSSRWAPQMRPFIWGSKNKIHLIDISKTAFLLERAGKFLKNITSNGKSILWIGTKKPAQSIIQQTATSLKMPFVINRWIGGTLTNFDQVKKAITRLLHLQDVIKKNASHYKKKEISMIQKEIARLEKNIGGIIDLDFPPAAIILVDAKKEQAVVREAKNANIPIIAMVDTNTNPKFINFVIPSNDDSPRSIAFIIEYLGNCAQDGKKIYDETKKEEKEAAKKENKSPVLEKKVFSKAKTTESTKTLKENTQKEQEPITKKAEAKINVPIKKTITQKITTEKIPAKLEKKETNEKKATATKKISK